MSDVQIHSRNLANLVVGVIIQVAAILWITRVLNHEEARAVDVVQAALLAGVESCDAGLNVALKVCRAIALLLQEVICAWKR